MVEHIARVSREPNTVPASARPSRSRSPTRPTLDPLGDHPRDPELAVRRLLRAVQPSNRIRVLLQVHYPSGLPLCLNIFRVRWARTGTVFFWSAATGENHPTFKLAYRQQPW